MKIIQIHGLNRHFDTGEERFHALREIDLEVEKGECVILRGVSGSGKTTLLSIIAGLDHPSSGELLVEGEAIAKLPDRHLSRFRGRHIGMIFQHYNLLEHFSVRDNVAVPLIPLGVKMQELRRRCDEAMELANIAHKAEAIAGRLSGGEKQRAAIARALAADPEIILCDEPTANLDRANARRFLEILGRLHALGKTILVATHDPIFEELEFPVRVVEMEDGRIME